MRNRDLTPGRDEQPRGAFAQPGDVPRPLRVLWQHPLSYACAHSTGNGWVCQVWVFQRGDPVEGGMLGGRLTYDRRTLENRRAPIKDKDRFYSPEEKFADAT